MNCEEAHRLGAELELVGCSSQQTLLEHMGGAVNPLRNSVENGVHTLWLELAPSENSLDEAISRYAAIFDALPPEFRAVWDSCIDRCVNVGLQAGLRPHAFPLLASHNAIAELARLGLRLQITLYAPDSPATGIAGNQGQTTVSIEPDEDRLKLSHRPTIRYGEESVVCSTAL